MYQFSYSLTVKYDPVMANAGNQKLYIWTPHKDVFDLLCSVLSHFFKLLTRVDKYFLTYKYSQISSDPILYQDFRHVK